MIRHLHDVAGLEPLEQVAREYDVDIIASGGLARRLFTRDVREPEITAPDLFDLVPFTADIDLTHTGASELTQQVMRAIREAVPMAECFRWELRSAAEAEESRVARAYAPVVPVHAVTLGVLAGFDDPLDARSDLEQRRHRYRRNPEYASSPRFLAGQDLEAFGALRYLRTIFEDESYDVGGATMDALRDTFLEGISAGGLLRRLNGSRPLRARLLELQQSLAVEMRTADARRVFEESMCRVYLDFVAETLAGTSEKSDGETGEVADLGLDADRAITASELLGEAGYRLPRRIEFHSPGIAGSADQTRSPFDLLRHEEFQAPGVRVLRVSNWVSVTTGVAGATFMDDGVANEMIHFALLRGEERDDHALLDEDIGMLVIFRRGLGAEGIQVASPLATCVSRPFVRPDGTMTSVRTIRAACGSLFDRLARDDDGGALKAAFVIAARDISEDPGMTEIELSTLAGRDDYERALETMR
jgi:hypothetical protein